MGWSWHLCLPNTTMQREGLKQGLARVHWLKVFYTLSTSTKNITLQVTVYAFFSTTS